jgi:hypothetical protein
MFTSYISSILGKLFDGFQQNEEGKKEGNMKPRNQQI